MNAQNASVGRQKILDVAESLFTEHGYQAVSIRQIAQACGLTNAALYYHFDSKEALYKEVLEHYTARLGQRMREAAAEHQTIKEQVIAILAAYVDLVASRRSLFFALRHRPAGLSKEEAHQHHAQLFHTILDPLEDALRRAVGQGELQALPEDFSAASLLLGMLHGLIRYRHACHQADIDRDDIQTITETIWYGMVGQS
jgi:AcrR family transcriptional regulator